jgi:hypothetical protein
MKILKQRLPGCQTALEGVRPGGLIGTKCGEASRGEPECPRPCVAPQPPLVNDLAVAVVGRVVPRQPALELEMCRYQGEHVGRIARQLVAGT